MTVYHHASFSSDEEDPIMDRYDTLVFRLAKDWSELKYQVDLEVLLLPNWCKLHDSSHSKFACELCQEAMKQVKEQARQPSARHPLLATRIKVEDQEPEPSDNVAKGGPQEDVGIAIEEGQQYSLGLPSDEVD